MRKSLASTAMLLAMASMAVLAYAGSFPVIINVTVTGITSTSATINWQTTQAADSQVAYGITSSYASLTALDPALATSHSQMLTGLSPNIQIHYQVRSKISSGLQYMAGDFVFTTAPNIVTGMISGLAVASITNSSATFTWTTNVPSSSTIEYGPTSSYVLSAGSADLVTSHSVIVSGLAPFTLYHFRAKSIDASGNAGITDDATFTTSSVDVTPTVADVAASFVTGTTATITWSTNVPANCQVLYGLAPSLGSASTLDPIPATVHARTLTGLTPNTTYFYQIQAMNPGADPAVSDLYYLTTPALSLFIPEVALAPNEFTDVAFANLDAGPAALNFTAFDATGIPVQGLGVTNPAVQLLPSGSQMAASVDQLFGPVSANWPLGWTSVNSSTTNLTGFFLTMDPALTVLEGTTLPSAALNALVFPETGTLDYTRLMLSNQESSAASVTVDVVQSDGTIRASLQTTIPPFGTLMKDLRTEMFAGSGIDPSDYIQVTSSTGLVAFELFGNVSKDVAILSGQDVNGGGTTLYSPQFVVGDPIKSELSIVNLDTASGFVNLRLVGNDGVQIGNSQYVPIAGNGKISVLDPAFFLGAAPTGMVQGYVEIVSSGVRLNGSVAFSDTVQGTFATALPLVTSIDKSLVLSHVASNASFYTGLAIVNPYAMDQKVQVQLFTADGLLDQSTTIPIPAGNRVSQVLTQYFPALLGQDRTSGYIKVIADQGVACFGVFGTGDLSVLAAIPAQAVR